MLMTMAFNKAILLNREKQNHNCHKHCNDHIVTHTGNPLLW